jgi:16S rRNA (adenine1518-N6/adenine1519-N6)-dimethyltransferase
VTIQAEVADRIVAKPGSRDYGPLAVYASLLTSAEIIGTLPPSCFWPEPEVTSALVALERRSDAPAFDPDGLGAFLHTLFSKRRKQIGTTLGREGAWPKGVEPTMRPEELSPQQLLALMLARASR